MLRNRIARDGRVIHYHGNNVISYGRPNQCEYNACEERVSGWDRHCWKHRR